MFDKLFVFACTRLQPWCVISSTFIHTWFSCIRHLIIQLFVKLADLLLVLVPLFLRDVDHDGGGDRARAAGSAWGAGAAQIKRQLLGVWRSDESIL